ncbi:MAG: hypothetical protein AB2806_08930 [Candidatus Thiodiazotropha sp.]
MSKKVYKGERERITVEVNAVMMADFGKIENVPVKLTFIKVHLVDSLLELFSFKEDGEPAVDSETVNKEAVDIIKDYLVDWDIELADGEPEPLTAENIKEIMNHKAYRDAILGGFQQVQLGLNALKAKNS